MTKYIEVQKSFPSFEHASSFFSSARHRRCLIVSGLPLSCELCNYITRELKIVFLSICHSKN